MFKIGDKIAHPMHGAGVIDSIEERKTNGTVKQYYVLRIPLGDMVVMIPTEACDTIGVRSIITPEQANEILDSIPMIESDMTQNWNKRYRENMVKIKSGDLMQVAQVIKGLMERDNQKGLSTGERKMLHSAKQIFISEIVMSKNSSYDKIEARINSLMAC